MEESFEKWLKSQPNPEEALEYVRNEYKTEEEKSLEDFAERARAVIPRNDKLLAPGAGTKFVDSFLYTDEVLDEWVEEGSFSRSFCGKCGNDTCENYSFLSDSFSIDELGKLFTMVPRKGNFLDIGSRFGVCMLAASLYATYSKIQGVELDADMVNYSNKLKVPGQITQADIRKCAEDLVPQSDVILMNNVFEYFMSPEDELECWRKIFEHAKKGQTFALVPSFSSVVDRLEQNPVLLEIQTRLKLTQSDDDIDLFIYTVVQ